MQVGSEQFTDWMRRRGFNQSDAARYLEMEASYISILASGKRTPGLMTALKLERLTGIPVEAWASSALDDLDPVAATNDRKRSA